MKHNTPDLPPTRGYSDQPQGEVCPPVQTGGGASFKTCLGCHSKLPLTAFCRCHKRIDGKRGHDSRCKTCRASAQRIKQASLNETQRVMLKRTKREWQAKHPHAARARWANQHARRLDVAGTLLEQDVDAAWIAYSGLCWVCGEKATQLDHFRPINKTAGGMNTADNIRPICDACNHKRDHGWHGEEVAEKEAQLLRQIKRLLAESSRSLQPDVGTGGRDAD